MTNLTYLRANERVAFALVCLGIATSSIYVAASGGIQPAHFAIILAVAILATKIKPVIAGDFALLAYAIYATIRELIAVFWGAGIEALLPAGHAWFAFIVFVCLRKVFTKAPAEVLWKVMLVALLIAIVGVTYSNGLGALRQVDVERAAGSFNNPNQLGYFSLLIGCSSALLFFHGSIRTPLLAVLLSGATYLALVSLSKSAIAAAGLLLCAVLSHFLSRRNAQIIIILAWAAAAAYLAFSLGLFDRVMFSDFSVFQRFATAAQENDSSWAVRGYGVLVGADWSDIMFGLSSTEVAALRDGFEVHSSYMAPVASYGILGGAFLILFLAWLCTKVWMQLGMLQFSVLLLPILIYGVAHNGARTPLFWIYAALVYSLALSSKSKVAGAKLRAE